jgi:hypothetical protein
MTTVELKISITGPVGSRKGTLLRYIKHCLEHYGTIKADEPSHSKIHNMTKESQTMQLTFSKLP